MCAGACAFPCVLVPLCACVCMCVSSLHSRCSHDVLSVSQVFLMEFPRRKTCTRQKIDPVVQIDRYAFAVALSPFVKDAPPAIRADLLGI